MMTNLLRTIALLALGTLAGCSSGAPDTSTIDPPPPHGGTLQPIPGNLGFVEVVSGNGTGAEAMFYFLDDNNAPITGAPTSGTLTVGKKDIPLTAEGGGLAAPAGSTLFKGGPPQGDLKVEIGGTPVVIGLGIR